ncbi:hypothetical protein [Desulfobacca acetoxidans]|uniref:Uncharacterized protein n=1 Tax=Desulfobacca acetoxidans (strain ATCC 700848 / DSM 11109 / ASRB2) TaxID=880072 RepID=F2NGZ2_DESAR|nr:hypothetical protein [Desulfobacca acetoxidans]AEB08763.1 hypothetical protein Desac_0888 [Desulfobacca acetoxidans DSM 11109]
MYTQVQWNITLSDKRQGEHELKIKIFDYKSSDTTFDEIIALPPQLYISNFRSEANNSALLWAGDQTKTIEISQIAKCYQDPLPNPLIVHCKFDTEEFTSTYDDFAVVALYHNVQDLKSTSIDMFIALPEISVLRFYIDNILLKILSFLDVGKFCGRKGFEDVVGIYKITAASGAKVQRWEVLESGPRHILKFNISGGAFETSVDFSYVHALNPFWYLISAYVSYKVLHWLLSVI